MLLAPCRLFALALLALAALPLRAEPPPCAVPKTLDDGWTSAMPADAGFDTSALCAILDGVARGDANIHAVVVERRGQLVAELYRRGSDRSIWSPFAQDVDFGPTRVHDLRSVSKSVVGLLVGVAVQQGKIASIAMPALQFYPEYAELRSPERDAITLERLLTMSSGLRWNEAVTTYGGFDNDETRLYWDWAPYRYVLSRPFDAVPGAEFNYNGGGTAVLADILVRTAGASLREYARKSLFEPLGISDWEWVADPYGRPLAFAGLRMRPRDLAKIGRLVLAHGQWQGRQVLPADWVNASLQPHIATGDGLHYGYQWWVGAVDWQGKVLAWSAAFGNGGQRLYVVPELDLAVVITAGDYNSRQIGRTVSQLFKQVVATVRN
jgi:CubicO group peptidase (beta-lactamase class C family)